MEEGPEERLSSAAVAVGVLKRAGCGQLLGRVKGGEGPATATLLGGSLGNKEES